MKPTWTRYALPVSTMLAFVTVAVLAFTTYQNTVDLREGERQVVVSHAIRQATHQLLSALKDMQTGERGYLITGDPKYLVPYNDGVVELKETFQRLEALTQSDAEQSQFVVELEELIEKKQEFLETAIALRRKSEGKRIGEEVIDLIASEGGEQLMASAREKANLILSHEALKLSAHELQSENLSSTSYKAIVIGNALALTVIVISGAIAYLDRRRRDASEASLLAKESELSAIFNTTTDAILSFDRDLSIRLMNPAAHKILHSDDSSSLPDSLLSLISIGKDTSAQLEDFLESPSRTERISGTGRYADGREFPFVGRLAKVEDCGTQFNLLLFQDMTEAYASEFRKRELAAVLEQVEDAIVVCNLDDEIISWNKGAELLYNISAEDAIGQPAQDLLLGNAKDAWQVGSLAIAAEDHYATELTLHVPNREEVQIEHRRSLIRDSAGKPHAQLVMHIDVTEKRREEAKERRSQRLESIGTLAGGVAHDLNNVLTPILMNAKLARRPGANQARLLEVIVASAERGGSMIRKLLAFAGGERAAVQEVDVEAVVMELQEILNHTLPKTIRVETVVAKEGVSTVLADPTELSQVIMNLAINARDAMPDGGKVEIELRDFKIDPALLRSSAQVPAGDYVLLTISDQGDGVPKELCDRIFDPFFTTKAQGKGTGLGLATSLGIVRSFGGDITVYSEPGRGAKFAVYLPVASQPSKQTEVRHDELEEPIGQGELVLVVDDEPYIVESVRESLENGGYQVVCAIGGLEAIERCREYRDQLQLVILDMMMPDLDGSATQQQLRSIAPGIKVIFSSGLRRPGAEGHSLAGSDGFLAKPYSNEELLQTVRSVLDGLP